MKINPLIFRAYDIRGIYGKDLTEEVFKRIGFVLGKKKETFLVGHDIRSSGPKLSLALISGLITGGAKKVYFCQEASFGLCFFSGWKLRVDKTFFVTASHLPKEWNGLKIAFGDGEPISSLTIQKIKNEVLKIEKKKINFKKPKFEKVSLKEDYILYFLKIFSSPKKRQLKIVLDCGNGATSLVVPEIFKKFGFGMTELFCQPDPNFPNRSSEPTPEAVKILINTVLQEKADFGVAFDGDGDRAVIIDDKGRYLRGDQIGILLAKNILRGEKRRATVVKTVSCTMAVEEELKKLGTRIVEVQVGHNFVGRTCKKEKAVLGIEESSHLYFPKIFHFDDAILTPLYTAEVVLNKNKKLSQLIDEIPLYHFEEKNFSCPDEIKFEVIKKLKKKFKKEYKKINTLDGIKVYFKNGWVLIRASNTSPKIKLYVEAKDKRFFDFLREKFGRELTQCIQQ